MSRDLRAVAAGAERSIGWMRRPELAVEKGYPALPPRIARLAANGVVAAGFVVAYVVLEWVSFIHEYKGVPVTPWNPGVGVVFGLMLSRGAHHAVLLFLGAALAELLVLKTALPWWLILAISGAFAAGYGAVAAVARRALRLDVRLDRLRDMLVLLAAGISGACLVALLVSALLIVDARLDRGDVLFAAGPLLVGDVIGIAVMTPLTLRLVFRGHAEGSAPADHAWRRLVPEALLYIALVAVSLWVIVEAGTEDGFKFFYLLFLPVVAAAVRHGLDGSCIGLALTQFALVALLHRQGYDVGAFTAFQLLMLVLTTTGLIVGVVVSERRSMDRLARDAEARLKEKESEVASAARSGLVSGMASALAHEINQPLTAARALARSAQQLLRTPGGDMARADGNLATMIAQIDHAAEVVRRMRDFLRRGQPHVSTIDLRTMIEDALMLARAQAASGRTRLEVDVAEDLPPVFGDHVQLQQVILNLVRNAMDAIAASGQSDGCIRIAARRRDAPAGIEIAVQDNGPGIGDAVAERLFSPLATTKPEGLGLGLSICAAIVESHGGRLWLHARAPGATEFRFSLPLQPATAT